MTSEESGTPQRKNLEPAKDGSRFLLAIALGVVCFAYQAAPQAGFLWDDLHLVQPLGPITQSSLTTAFTEPLWMQSESRHEMSAFYRPLVTASFLLDHALWNSDPSGFHITNLALHLVVCALLFALCLRAGTPPLVAAGATALFGLLPRGTECVAWISGRADLIASIGVLAALAVHGRGRMLRWWATPGLFLGLLGKEVAIAGLGALVALEVARWRRGETSAREACAALLPGAVALLGYGALRFIATPDVGGVLLSDSPWDGATRLLLFLQALGSYLLMLLDPLHPALRIGRVGAINSLEVALGVFAFAAVIWLCVRAWTTRWSSEASAPLVLAIVSLLPVLHLVSPLQEVVASDRYLYLPSAAGALVLAPLVARAIDASRGTAACVAGAAFALGIAFTLTTYNRVALFGDEVSLWKATSLAAHPLDPLPLVALGGAYARREQSEAAVDTYYRALKIEQAFAETTGISFYDPELQGALGLALSELGRYDEALAFAREGVSVRPDLAVSHLYFAVVHARRLEFSAAEAALEQSLERFPSWGRAQAVLASTKRAATLWRSLGPVAPGEPVAQRAVRAQVYALVGRRADAEVAFAAIARDPGATSSELRLAAVFLVHRGDADAALTALTRLSAEVDSADPLLAALKEVLSVRQRPGSGRFPRSPQT